MRLKFAGLAGVLAHLVLQFQTATPADACGVKLTVKPSAPRKAVARSSNPSQVLLVGAPPRRLERDLAVAGHNVEVTRDASGAKKDRYAVVIVDSDQQASAARERFAGAKIIVRSGDTGSDLRNVEDNVRGTVVAAASKPDVVAAKETRTPVAAGPAQRPPAAAAKPIEAPAEAPTAVATAPTTPTPAPTPPPPATRPAPTPPPAEKAPPPPPAEKAPKVAATTTPRTSEDAPAPKPSKDVVSAAEIHEEIYFRVNGKSVASSRPLEKTVKWLTANTGVNVTIEGHADPTGSSDLNMELSRERAEAVKAFLVEKGIEESRIEVKALGDTALKYGAKDGRNRRVAIDATR